MQDRQNLCHSSFPTIDYREREKSQDKTVAAEMYSSVRFVAISSTVTFMYTALENPEKSLKMWLIKLLL